MKYFNPRGPLGPRHYHPVFDALVGLISIHAVLWDRDIRTLTKEDFSANFNPRGPLGPRRTSLRVFRSGGYFNPRGPLGPRRQASQEGIHGR